MKSQARSNEIEYLLSKAENNALYRAQPDEMLRYAREGSQLAKKTRDTAGIARGELALGIYALDQGKFEEGLKHSLTSLRAFQETADQEREVTALRHVGIARALLEQYAESLDTLSLSLSQAYAINADASIGLLHYEIGNLFNAQGATDIAIEHFSQALPKFEEAHERTFTFAAFHMGVAQLELHNEVEGHELLAQAFSQVEEDIRVDVYDRRVGTSPFDLKLMGDVYRLQGNHNRAFQIYQQALLLLKRFNIPVTEAECLMELGKASVHLGNYSEATEYFEQAVRVTKTVSNKTLRARIGLEVARFHQILGLYAKAESGFRSVLTYAHQGGNRLLKVKALEGLAQVNERQNNFLAATGYYREANALLRDFRAKKADRFTPAKAPGKLLSNSPNGEPNSELDRANKANDRLTSIIKEQRAMILSVKDAFQRASQSQQESRALAKEILEMINTYLEGEQRDQNLQENLNSLADDTIQKLSKKYPSLSAAELQICSLISVGLESKRIEEILCLSRRTVENHRFRIRRKMALRRSEKLEEALKNL